MRNTGGVTLIEVLLASALALVVGLTALSIFRLLHKATRETSSSYVISRDLEEAQRNLRADLRETALASVRLVPQKQGPAALACVTSVNEQGRPQLSPSGTPEWCGWVFYRLLTQPGQPARLERRLVRRPGSLPDVPASFNENSGQARVLLTEVAPPDFQSLGPAGGFELSFLRLDPDGRYQNSPTNPALVTAGISGLRISDNTRLIEVRLAVVEGLSTSTPSFLQIPIRVCPRY